MKGKWFIGLLILVLAVSCQKAHVQKLELVKDGVPSGLKFSEMRREKGYWVGEGEFGYSADQAVFGDVISLQIKMSINDFKGFFGVRLGDNTVGFMNTREENISFMSGPSIGKSVQLGSVFDHIQPDVPFTLSVNYKDEKMILTINGKEICSHETIIPPEGSIGLGAEVYGRMKVYDLVCEGRFKPVEDFYTAKFLLDRAHKSVAAAAEIVRDDPNRPAYHFQPPANWNNDPNGMLFYDGYYHMFYQHNPYGDRWDWMHWGHARSKDLVLWEHLPIALWPSVERGENHCFSGSGFIKDDGKPILFYTSIGHENPEHWAALPMDNKLKKWKKHPANPILVMEDHDGQHIDDWRDPFLFREGKDTYMVIGGHPRDEKGSIMMYKALNSELTKWDFLGTPFTGEEKNWECPNFFKVGEKYVLIYSPHGQVEYYTGTMDFEKFRFTTETHGLIDNGSEWNYYAPNTLQKENGRRILFGWIPGFKENQGWQSAISLPRDLSINEKGKLIQKPVPELEKLRGDRVSETDVKLGKESKKLEIFYPQFEMIARIAGEGTNHLGFRFNQEDGTPYEILLTPRSLLFGEEKVEVDPELGEKIKTVRFYFDRTVIEMFVNDGSLCATEVIYPDKENLNFEIFNPGREMTIESMDIWKIKSIW